jgi:hypothetical protein
MYSRALSSGPVFGWVRAAHFFIVSCVVPIVLLCLSWSCLMCSMLSLNCSFLIAPSVFSNVDLDVNLRSEQTSLDGIHHSKI